MEKDIQELEEKEKRLKEANYQLQEDNNNLKIHS